MSILDMVQFLVITLWKMFSCAFDMKLNLSMIHRFSPFIVHESCMFQVCTSTCTCIHIYLVSQERISLCSLGYPGTSPVDQAGLKLAGICLRLPLSTEIKVLGLKAAPPLPSPGIFFKLMYLC